jgi:sarcosine oxidase
MQDSYDTIVIGLGAVGAATLWHLARRGQRVLGLDRWDPPHSNGSTHGDTRITRCAIGEGEIYVPLVLRSHQLWRELEADTGEHLLTQCGALILASRAANAVVHGKANFVGRTIAAANRYGIAHEVLAPAEVMHRFPQFQLAGDELAYFEAEGGYVRPERCVRAQLAAAQRLGATVRGQTQVVRLERDGAGVTIITANGDRIRAARAVLAAGVWSPGLAGATLAPHMSIARQVLHWFQPDDPAHFAPERFPVFIWAHGDTAEDSFYGFPVPPGTEGVKLAREQYSDITNDPDTLRRRVAPDEGADLMSRHAAGRLRGLAPTPLRSVVCPYTNTPDGDFLITPLPHNDHVLLVSACSSHGFKHSAGLGELVAEAVLADRSGELDAFGAERLSALRSACDQVESPDHVKLLY